MAVINTARQTPTHLSVQPGCSPEVTLYLHRLKLDRGVRLLQRRAAQAAAQQASQQAGPRVHRGLRQPLPCAVLAPQLWQRNVAQETGGGSGGYGARKDTML